MPQKGMNVCSLCAICVQEILNFFVLCAQEKKVFKSNRIPSFFRLLILLKYRLFHKVLSLSILTFFR